MKLRLLGKLVLSGLVFLGFMLVSSSNLHADTAGDLTLQGRAALVSRDGHRLTLGTEGDDNLVVIQNNTQTLSINGSTGALTVGGSFIYSSGATLLANTTDGADTSSFCLSAGSACNLTGARGAIVAGYGNENANVGAAYVLAGLGGGALTIGTQGAGNINVKANDTVVMVVSSTQAQFNVPSVYATPGNAIVMAKYVPTMAATPVAGTNIVLPGLNVVPTAAVSTAALMKPTPVIGEEYIVINESPNAVRIKAGALTGINGGAAGTYAVLATRDELHCRVTSAANVNCTAMLGGVITPTGP